MVIIKRATTDKLNELLKLYTNLENYYKIKLSAEEKTQWCGETLKLINNTKLGGVFIALESNRIIGYLSYYFVKGTMKPLKDCVFLNELYVKSKYRKKGVATKLIQSLFRIRIPAFVKRFSVTTSPQVNKVINFYENLGFQIKGKTKAGNVKLEKNLVQ